MFCMRHSTATIVILVLAGVGYVLFSWRSRHAANQDFERLLGGDAATSILRIKISQQDHVNAVVDAPESLNYLSERLRHAVPHEGKLGSRYDVEFRLSTDRCVNCGIEFPPVSDQITIVFPYHYYRVADPDWYAVELSPSIPKDLDKLFSELGGKERPRAK